MNHSLKLTCVLSLLALLAGGVQPASAQQHIRVASFNVANFGDRDEYKRSLVALTNVILATQADLVALQEVEPNELGREQVRRLTELLNLAAEHHQTSAYSHVVAAEHVGDETVAFIFRSPVELTAEVELLPHVEDADGDGKRTFQRVPHVAEFRAGNLDFAVVNAHLYTKVEGASSEGRGDELEALADWLMAREAAAEKDAIVLGDFNRFLNDSDESEWGKIHTAGHADHYRFVLLEAIKNDVPGFDPRNDDAPEDKYSTTTSKKRSIYDQIIIAKGTFHEFTGTPKFGVDVGIVPFDHDGHYAWFVDKWHLASSMLSDHRPVWVRLRIDQTDDD